MAGVHGHTAATIEQLTIADAAQIAQRLLGQKITAASVGVKDPKRVGAWKSGDAKPQSIQQRTRLLALGAVLVLFEAAFGDDKDLLEGWYLSPNPNLRDRSPLEAIREDDGRAAIAAVRLLAA